MKKGIEFRKEARFTCVLTPTGKRNFGWPLCDTVITKHIVEALKSAGVKLVPEDYAVIPEDASVQILRRGQSMRWILDFEVFADRGKRLKYRGTVSARMTCQRGEKPEGIFDEDATVCTLEAVEGVAYPA